MSEKYLEPMNAIAYGHFLHWWSLCLPRYRADEEISAMWSAYPFGALTVDSDWAWWPLERVAALGGAMASELHCDGLVVAECRQGAAVLTWPDSPEQSQILMVAYPRSAGGVTKPMSAPMHSGRFLKVKGFAEADHVIACAITPPTVTVETSMCAIQSWTSARSKTSHSARFASSEVTRNNSQRH